MIGKGGGRGEYPGEEEPRAALVVTQHDANGSQSYQPSRTGERR